MPLIRHDDSVLTVIDAQPGFYRDRADVDEHALTSFVERAGWVAGVAAALDVPAVVTVERPDRNGDTAAAIASRLRSDAPIFPKAIFGLTSTDAIRGEIEALGRHTVVIVGMETDVCVAQSAIGLRDLGYRVVAVVDALFAPGEAHLHGLERLRAVGTELVSAKGLFYEWLPSLDAVRRLKTAHPELAVPPGFRL